MKVELVDEIHQFLVKYFNESEDPISPPGIKNRGALESACARPYSTAGRKELFASEFEKAAALFHGIISNHCFHNGNKRTALLSTLYFLGENNFWLDKCENAEMFEFTRQTAAHEICDKREDEISTIVGWFEKNSRRIIKGEKLLSLIELRDILKRFEYDVEENKSYVDITREGQIVQKLKKKGRSGLEEYDREYVAELRKRLNLTVAYGIDSARFYGEKGISDELNDYMQLHSEVFRWLAKI
ncbi:Fic family protein [Azotosporobacter soli]|uniref:type II toxin-antitoxin system death-on-curing family toxin n=1 Tax=Azotosporobacter soli TaxID=3055040 RepID=UPI0031FE8299